MATTLRQLLIQRAARLQERPAITASAWGTLSWTAWRNRVEGVAMGLLATSRPLGEPILATGHGPWDWAAEVAGACCGLRWEPNGQPVPEELLRGTGLHAEAGRGPYHDRETDVVPATPFSDELTQEALLLRLHRWNRRLGWDHTTEVPLSELQASTSEGRAALWCALYAGAHVQFLDPVPPPKGLKRWLTTPPAAGTDLGAFTGFWSE